MEEAILKVENLRIEFFTQYGPIPVIDDLSFSLKKGGDISFVGESGCGKSMTSLAIMGLLPPGGKITRGRILFKGEDLVGTSQSRLETVRGNEISMIFQEPMTSLNPLYRIGDQIAEVLLQHKSLSVEEAWKKATGLLDAVKIPNAKIRIKDYPHRLSGGQRQRVMIAMALACEPEILIADEPTTALDVTVQDEIFDLLAELKKEFFTAIILITHDIGAVVRLSENILVMYAGRKIEEGATRDIVRRPRHPYTKGLIGCIPHIRYGEEGEPPLLAEINGIVPSLQYFGRSECLFAPRCVLAEDACRHERPAEQIFQNKGSIPQGSACRLANTL